MSRSASRTKTCAGPTREQILIDIYFNLGLVRQWREVLSPGWSENVSKYMHIAEALIELLEVQDCGSTGGFDRHQTDEQRDTLYDRFVWLVNKHALNEAIFNKGIVHFNWPMDDMKTYWSRK